MTLPLGRSKNPDITRFVRTAVVVVLLVPILSACRSDVLPAVFGLGAGGIAAYAPGTLPVVAANEGDRLIGQSGTQSGRCIYENDAGRRFRADCPPGYKP